VRSTKSGSRSVEVVKAVGNSAEVTYSNSSPRQPITAAGSDETNFEYVPPSFPTALTTSTERDRSVVLAPIIQDLLAGGARIGLRAWLPSLCAAIDKVREPST